MVIPPQTDIVKSLLLGAWMGIQSLAHDVYTGTRYTHDIHYMTETQTTSLLVASQSAT